MTTIEILAEEPSAKQALRVLLPKLLPRGTGFRIIDLQSKYKLLKVLEDRLRAYRRRIEAGEDLQIVVLVDRDDDDCHRLKARIERAADAAGLATKSRPDSDGRFRVVNRVVVEELESWFIGDPSALRRAFPKLPAINENASPFRNPDNGGSWEALHRFLKRNGIYSGTYPKQDAARRIAEHMDIRSNRSASFRAFVGGIEAALHQGGG